MNDFPRLVANLPPEQQAIRAKCFHPSGTFVEFRKEEIEQSIPERFEKIVHQYRDRLAVASAKHQFTYDALNRVANRIAHAILAECSPGVEPIALLLETDAPVIAAILGVLKAGKIYVPLDSSLPRARLAYILENSQAILLITNSKNLSFALELSLDRLPIINLDALDPSLPTDSPAISLSPEASAWILYTSGSTGQPKGVVQSHRNALHFIRTYANGVHICPDDRLTLLFTCSANGGAHDTFSALLNGASLYSYNVRDKGPAAMADWLIRNQITIYCSVPTVFRYFLETLTGEENFLSLRLIKLIGEPVSKRDVELYQKYFSRQCFLLNRLGSTETGTIRWYFIDKNTQIDGNIVPAGYPADDYEVLLLDGAGREIESEGVGEIAVKSRYLTAGYWGRPDLTDAAFLPAAGDERIYRTGDIGRMLPDGRLMCLGRKDSQVKIRGHRVELTEIEMALMDLPSIKDAVVIAGSDRFNQECIIAYLVPKRYPRPTVTELRRALGERLPEHMIPSVFMFLREFPLAPNGKLDRKSLPEPDYCRPELETPYVAPSTPFEIELANIWAELLGLNRVGIHDNFFDLGGHSLTATRVVSRVIKKFQSEIPLQSLFVAPTVAEMAAIIEQHQAKHASEETRNRMLSEIEAMTEDEAQKQLARVNAPISSGENHE